MSDTDSSKQQEYDERVERDVGDREFAEELVGRGKSDGLDLVGPDGVLTGLTKKVLEAGLEAELAERLGYDKHAPEGRNGGNSRNGTRPKTVLTEVGPVPLQVPRDRDGTFEPQLVKKRQRRLSGVDEMVISLTAKGLTTGEVSAHLAEVYGASVSCETEQATKQRLNDFDEIWGERYPAIRRLWDNAWAECSRLFLDYSPEMNRWKLALNAFAITFEGRLLPSSQR